MDIDEIELYRINKFRKKAWGLLNRLSTEIKRSATLGCAGTSDNEIIRTEDQLSKLLYKVGMASSLEDGRKTLKNLINRKLYYNEYYYLTIEETKDKSGNNVYKLNTSNIELGLAYM